VSDHSLHLIPENPSFVPEADREAAALELLRTLAAEATARWAEAWARNGSDFPFPGGGEVSARTDDHVTFRDAGENFTRVTCPGCQANIAMDTWTAWMSADYDGKGFPLRCLTLPCCGRQTTLNHLDYDRPQGFSRFELVADRMGKLPPDALAEIEKALGCKLRQINRML
jgi:hypothetical protein